MGLATLQAILDIEGFGEPSLSTTSTSVSSILDQQAEQECKSLEQLTCASLAAAKITSRLQAFFVDVQQKNDQMALEIDVLHDSLSLIHDTLRDALTADAPCVEDDAISSQEAPTN
mmetsp:Transcript_16782/g.27829  ORF Transcript_16782/g.27829 Transcript_16782/m.27829 type:complete len:116 (-) Transcript_16782:275-622(-)|eukprot:CAMPEP_0119323786 /NCGR_PEP_ID=MMETSP1333-20130426/61599_1 /TAXON_ID=418940 /ORGANISM="Scyphosphaera apsteinii, Strain RCC1455" /LENGTH=115 /DNA_ID=CAMNT_0007331329 /DNA_START=31 /DNA_END=378 /DNA_ORIENTATION=-